jgi:hypothetical protein
MSIRWFTTKALLLLFVLAVYSDNSLPQGKRAVVYESQATLRFGQTIVLSDFDSDGLIDVARIDGSGSRKGVKIPLSRTAKLLVLHFDTNRDAQGSLFAQDVDNDGATDLIWTDLLHPNDVIVWLGDGTGQFERVSATLYSDRFTFADTNVVAPESSTHETEAIAQTDRTVDRSLGQRFALRIEAQLRNPALDCIATLSPALNQPSGRSPPLRSIYPS